MLKFSSFFIADQAREAFAWPGRATCPASEPCRARAKVRILPRQNFPVVLRGNLDIFCKDVRHFLQWRDPGRASPPTWRHAAYDVSYVITNYEAVSDFVGH